MKVSKDVQDAIDQAAQEGRVTENGRPKGKDWNRDGSAKGRAKAEAGIAKRKGEQLFEKACEAHGLPLPVPEYPFGQAVGRKWKADWLFEGWLIVEQVGGVWVGGHHSGGQNQIDDMERRNHAALLGYAVLEFTPQQFDDGSAFAMIKRVLAAEVEQP